MVKHDWKMQDARLEQMQHQDITHVGSLCDHDSRIMMPSGITKDSEAKDWNSRRERKMETAQPAKQSNKDDMQSF